MWFLNIVEEFFSKKFAATYSSRLEEYIISHDPKTEADVEKLTIEFHKKMTSGYY
jgi:hypothetical protein